jgi:hypothetical protein
MSFSRFMMATEYPLFEGRVEFEVLQDIVRLQIDRFWHS